MLQTFFDCWSEVGIENEHFVQEIYTWWRNAWKGWRQVGSGTRRKGLKVICCFVVCYKWRIFFCRGPYYVEDYIELVISGDRESISFGYRVRVRREWEARISREEWFSLHAIGYVFLHHREQFCEDAANRPHVDLLSVVLLEQNQLWRTVPTSHYMSSQFSLHVLPQILCLH